MILVRTPLRISLGGGATDLPSYADQHGGFCVTATIDRYVYLAANPSFSGEWFLRYGQNQRCSTPDEIRHPLFRAALTHFPIHDGPQELIAIGDVPGGTGLGSSAAFTVGLLQLIATLNDEPTSPLSLAKSAVKLEREVAGRPVGLMDAYACAFGGITAFEFYGNGIVRPVLLSATTRAQLEARLLLFYVGGDRESADLLRDQETRTHEGDPDMLQNLKATRGVGLEVLDALEGGNLARFAPLLTRHQELKGRRSPGIATPYVQELLDLGLANGASGGKLQGAGGGGFLLFYAEDPERLRAALHFLPELEFNFTDRGPEVLLS